MRFSTIVLAGALAAVASALPASVPHRVLEKRIIGDNRWREVKGVELHEGTILPMRIGLIQNNLDNGYDLLMDVSHPSSKNYGKHWSAQKVRESSHTNALPRVPELVLSTMPSNHHHTLSKSRLCPL